MKKLSSSIIIIGLYLFYVAITVSDAPAVSVSRDEFQSVKSKVAQLESRVSRLERKQGATYSGSGVLSEKPITTNLNGSFDRAVHTVSDNVKLADGSVTVTLSSSPTFTGADVSFGSTKYSVSVTASSTNSNRYIVSKLSGTSFKITSSDTTDTATVTYIAKGE